MRTKATICTVAIAGALLLQGGSGAAGASAKSKKITCHINLTILHFPTKVGPGEDFGFANCSQPLGRGVQYDTFTITPKTSTTGTAILKFKAYFDTGTVTGVWRATYKYTSKTRGVFKQKVTWTHGTGAFKNVRATGNSQGVQNGNHGTIDQTVNVTGL
jgi:hypothetical protein